jgi:hypothetical protein
MLLITTNSHKYDCKNKRFCDRILNQFLEMMLKLCHNFLMVFLFSRVLTNLCLQRVKIKKMRLECLKVF